MIAGVIDGDYRGNVGVVLFNLSKEDYKVKRGDRVAQLILERIFISPIEAVEVCKICHHFRFKKLPLFYRNCPHPIEGVVDLVPLESNDNCNTHKKIFKKIILGVGACALELLQI